MDQTKKLKNHKLLILTRGILGQETFLGPIFVLFYLNYVGLSLSAYLALEALLTMMIAIFEIPGGYISDFFGRKKVFIASQCVYIISKLLILIFPSYLTATVCFIIAGLALPFSSGNLGAIFYESFKQENKVPALQKYYSKAQMYFFINSFFASLIAGYLGKKFIAAPFIIDILISAATLSLTCFLLTDSHKLAKQNLTLDGFFKPIRSIFSKKTFQLFRSHECLFLVLVLEGLIFATVRGSYSFYQPYLINTGFDIFQIGILFSSFNLVCAVTAKFSGHYINNNKHAILVILSMCVLLILSFAGLSYATGYFSLLFFVFQQIVRGYYQPFFDVQKNINISNESSYRVSLLSIGRVFSMLCLGLFSWALAALLIKHDIRTSLLVIGAILSVAYLSITTRYYFLVQNKSR